MIPQLSNVFWMALVSLKRHPVRSILALLGVVIGIAGLVTTLSLGEGATAALEKQLLSMGKESLRVMSGNVFSYYDPIYRGQEPHPLTIQDYEALQAQIPHLAAATPVIENIQKVEYQGQTLQINVLGGNEQHIKTRTSKVTQGFFFNKYQAQFGEKVAVLGFSAAKSLFGLSNPIGKMIFIENHPFKVIGVLSQSQKKEGSIRDPDMNLWVPFNSVWKILMEAHDNALSEIILLPHDPSENSRTKALIRRILRFRHNLKEDQPDDFTIWDMNQMYLIAKKSSQTLHRFMFMAAGISLLVGGIGIMNILLVSMAERKSEIGLRMAIGASPSLILAQFLIESIILCLLGGFLGILAGIIGCYVAGWLTAFPWLLRWPAFAISILTTSFIGIIFGFYPAYRASKLHPIEALRSS
jgi:putative ABC transport system permease protein